MNRTLFAKLFKCIIGLLFTLLQLNAYAEDYYAIRDGNFDDLTIWKSTSGTKIAALDIRNGDNNFFILEKYQITIKTNLAIAINNLTISGSKLPSQLIIVSKANVTIKGSLTLSNGGIDFGTESVNFTLEGDLIGGVGSFIKQSPVLGEAQTLTLNGQNNNLESYSTNYDTNTKIGTSLIIYKSKKTQTIFPSKNYYNLLVSGGRKILKGDVLINNALTIKGDNPSLPATIDLQTYNLTYNGIQQNLNTSDGWINTSKVGYFYINSFESEKYFPVGDDKSKQSITLSSDEISKDNIGIRYSNSTANGLPTGDIGAWNIISSNKTNLSTTFVTINTINNSINEKTKIATYNGNKPIRWSVAATEFTKTSDSYSYSATCNFDPSQPNNWISLYNCPQYSISPSDITPIGVVGSPYLSNPFTVFDSNGKQQSGGQLSFTVSDNIELQNIQLNFSINQKTFQLESIKNPQSSVKMPFTMNYTDDVGCKIDEPPAYLLLINNPTSPNLSMANIDAQTYGAAPFKVKTYSRSPSKISYSINPTRNACATIDADGIITITCAGPSENTEITVIALQVPSGMYRGEIVQKTFKIYPAPGRLFVKNYGFLVNSLGKINAVSKPTGGVITFEQQSGIGVASVDNFGNVTSLKTAGQFTVKISVAETINTTAFDSIYTFNVYNLQRPPIAVGDTIVLEMGKDSTINILQNDKGQTGEIIPTNTDIDIENRGQQIKFYSTELGNFTIDSAGNLKVIPFNGFIGSGKMGYTISDNNGLTSDIAYVQVSVKSPFVIPELKANDIMTPNNDNINDALVIANTDLNKENSLIIIDEIGNKVYETSNYQNNWKGTDTKNNSLEPGVYFYVFKEKNSGRELKKYIQIVK